MPVSGRGDAASRGGGPAAAAWGGATQQPRRRRRSTQQPAASRLCCAGARSYPGRCMAALAAHWTRGTLRASCSWPRRRIRVRSLPSSVEHAFLCSNAPPRPCSARRHCHQERDLPAAAEGGQGAAFRQGLPVQHRQPAGATAGGETCQPAAAGRVQGVAAGPSTGPPQELLLLLGGGRGRRWRSLSPVLLAGHIDRAAASVLRCAVVRQGEPCRGSNRPAGSLPQPHHLFPPLQILGQVR